jgi:hypothetical protein
MTFRNELRRVSLEEDPDRFSRWTWGEVVERLTSFVAAKPVQNRSVQLHNCHHFEKGSQAKTGVMHS